MYEILIAVAAAITYALATFSGKVQKGEDFQPYKLIRAVFIGAVLGLIAHLKGVELTSVESYAIYYGANTGVVTVIDQVAKSGYRFIAGLVTKK